MVALCGLCTVLWAAPSKKEKPAGNPKAHEFVSDQSQCERCHEVVWKGSKGTLEENVFTVFFVDFCVECHPDNLRRSHPVNLDPYRTIPKGDYPDHLPLQAADEGGRPLMTCATCHEPHAERFKNKKLHVRQKEYPGHYGLYLTYYLRLGDHEPEAGYMELCQSCHPDM